MHKSLNVAYSVQRGSGSAIASVGKRNLDEWLGPDLLNLRHESQQIKLSRQAGGESAHSQSPRRIFGDWDAGVEMPRNPK